MAVNFNNQATLSYNDVTKNSNIVQGVINDVINASKTSVPEQYSAGDTVTFLINLINTSTSPLNNLTITDNLGAYTFGTAPATTNLIPLTYIPNSVKVIRDGVVQTTAVTTDIDADGNLVISGVGVNAQGQGTGITTIAYDARINEFAPLAPGGASSVTNTATITGNGLVEAITADTTITPDDELNLEITKALSPTQVADNGQITYTFTISNYGGRASTAADNIILSDTFDPYLDITSITLDGAAFPDGSRTYDAMGNFQTVPGALNVGAATYTQDPTTGAWTVTPYTTTLVITGTI